MPAVVCDKAYEPGRALYCEVQHAPQPYLFLPIKSKSDESGGQERGERRRDGLGRTFLKWHLLYGFSVGERCQKTFPFSVLHAKGEIMKAPALTADRFSSADTVVAPDRSKAHRGLSSKGGQMGDLASAASLLRERLGRSAAGPTQIVREVAERASRARRSRKAQHQHVYQQALLTSGKAVTPAEWTAATLAAGFYRLELEVPARLRQWRWRARQALHQLESMSFPFYGPARAERAMRRILPLIVLLGATAACSSLVRKDGEKGDTLALGPLPELSKPKAAAADRASSARHAPWTYVLPVDHGVRSDKSGEGHFRASRFHGEHNGLDLLAPVGTPAFSPCEGRAMGGVSRSFGNWVHIICPVPEQYMQAGGPQPWASFFYAHLDTVDLAQNEWKDVARGQAVGKVGKSGNARGPNVQPHLHLELIVQKNQRSAMDEGHLGSDQSSVRAADFFADSLSTSCMAPYGFEPKSGLLRRARRIDPFVALTCLSDKKPNFIKAPSPLTNSSLAWTKFYVAKDFNVNLGVEDSRIARR